MATVNGPLTATMSPGLWARVATWMAYRQWVNDVWMNQQVLAGGWMLNPTETF